MTGGPIKTLFAFLLAAVAALALSPAICFAMARCFWTSGAAFSAACFSSGSFLVILHHLLHVGAVERFARHPFELLQPTDAPAQINTARVNFVRMRSPY